jgi:hypothetical protein
MNGGKFFSMTGSGGISCNCRVALAERVEKDAEMAPELRRAMNQSKSSWYDPNSRRDTDSSNDPSFPGSGAKLGRTYQSKIRYYTLIT